MNQTSVVKVTIGENVFMLREPKISDTRLAAKVVGKKASSQMEMGVMLQEELLKLLLVEKNGQKLSDNEKMNLDNLITYAEYVLLVKVVERLAGGNEAAGEPELEFVTQ